MLSRIFKGKEVEKLQIEKFNIPSASEIKPGLEKKKQENQRKKTIDADKEESLTTVKNETRQILTEDQEKLQQQVKQARDNYINSLEELATIKQSIYKKMEKQLVELVFSVSRKVIGDQIKISSQAVLKMLKKGLNEIKEVKEYEIKINPGDYDIFIDKKDEIKDMIKTSGSIKFTKDDKIEPGGCQIITEHGEVSTEPGKQLDLIEREMSDDPGTWLQP